MNGAAVRHPHAQSRLGDWTPEHTPGVAEAVAPLSLGGGDPLPGGRTVRLLVVSGCSATEQVVQDMRWHGFDAHAAQSGATTLEEYAGYDVILLDIELPDIDGLAVCRAIRSASDVPIVGFVSESSELDRVLCLEAGCDDCIEKPYRSRELVARINAILRRVHGGPAREDPAEEPRRLRHGPLLIDPVAREVRVDGRPVDMTRKEFDLLYLLAADPEKVFTREELMIRVWEHPDGAEISPRASRTIDTHVSSLRSKLGGGGWIIAIRGVGFRFRGPGSAD
ncbi:response regulator transcription factor [Thermomonospora echinospora]|uniref:response regulator transcription factor n=1 Tax=Thermomonospora echinospora TaxID=1992 RepID=UPI001F477430|nr:response regulator transcription factor [Thermomonospora echinospora]